MGKVTKDRKTVLRHFLESFKYKKQSNDSKHSYQKAQERTLARKAALARKRAREAATKHQETINAILEPDKLLPNQEGTGMSGVYGIASAELKYRVAQQALPVNKDPLLKQLPSELPLTKETDGPVIGKVTDLTYDKNGNLIGNAHIDEDFDKKYAEVQQKLSDFAINRLGIPATIVNPPEPTNDSPS